MGRPRPILIIDTSVFLKDAFSRTRSGAATQILALAPAVAHIVLCAEMRDELLEKCAGYFAWTIGQVDTRYGPVLASATMVTPVAEQPVHRKMVRNDADDTMLVRTAEAVYVELPDLIEQDQHRLIVSENTRDLVPDSNYAGFTVLTAHGALVALRH